MEEADVVQAVLVLLARKAPTLSICIVDIDVPDPTPTLVNPPRGNLGALEPTPQQAATLPEREGEREGSRKVCLLDVASSKSHLHRPINFLSTICLPSRFGRVAACCGVGSQVSGWIPKGIACCGVGFFYLQDLLGSLYFGLC